MADPRINDIDIFEDDRDYLDRAVGAYEENVPLVAQIGMGFTPAGVGIDIAEATKYGRDAFRDLRQGNLRSGAINAGIAGLSALGVIPLAGDLIKSSGKSALKGLAKNVDQSEGILSLPPPKSQSFKVNNPIDETKLSKAELRETQNAFNSVQQFNSAEELFETAKRVNTNFQKDVNNIAGDLGHRTVGNPGETKLSLLGESAEREGKFIYSGNANQLDRIEGSKIDELVSDIDSLTGQPAGQVKKIPRILEKSAHKYKGDINQTTDPIRTRVIVQTTDEADEVAKKISKKFETIDSKNQVNVVGMRDRKLNIRYQDPVTGETLIGEIGVTTLPMHKAAELAHTDYNHVRSILREFGDFNQIPDEIVGYVDEAMENMNKIFKDADSQIDSSWLDLDNVKKYRYGGQVVGRFGNPSPIFPNSDSNSGLESFPPLAHSASRAPVPAFQDESPIGMYHSDASSLPRTTTAGSPSQLKYKLSDIISSPKSNIINSYKNKSTFTNNTDQPLLGGRKEII